MRIIVANDDGFYSLGIAALAEAASRFGEVLIMAPDGEQSAMSHAITIQHPLHYQAIKLGKFEAYRVNGTPADCVALGLYHWGGADLILSGINLGSNLGHDIWHSGTVAAAKQAALFGVRAYNGQIQESEDPRGRKHFWFGVVLLTEPEEGSDRRAVEHNLISMTPLRLDLTEDEWLRQLGPVGIT